MSLSSSITVTGTADKDGRQYRCVGTNPLGTQISNVAVIDVVPKINTQPADVSIIEYEATSFSVTTTGATSYQWQLNSGSGWANISGATAATYNVVDADVTFDGNLYRCLATGATGTVTSDSAELTVTVVSMLMSWKTDNTSTGSSANNQIKLPLTAAGTYNFVVNWGDSTSSTITSWNQAETTHTYASVGTYTVEITGVCRSFRFYTGGDRLKLLNISRWGTGFRLNNEGYEFASCTNLTITATDQLNMIGVTSLYGTFYQCSALVAPQSIINLDTANVQNFVATFLGATLFNADISGWDTSSATAMNGMFASAQAFNQPIDSWDVSNVTNFAGMFNLADVFNQNLNSWDTSSATSMSGMFKEAPAFNGNISDWDTSGVTTMMEMFQGATAFNQNIGAWDLSSVTVMTNMFRSAAAFNQDISGWSFLATDLTGMFYEATSFNQPLDAWDVSAVTNMTEMFYGATAFNRSLNSWDTANVTTTLSMFRGASAFNGNITSWNMSNAHTVGSMFQAATSFNQAIGSWTLNAALTGLGSMFSGATSFNQPLNSWNVSSSPYFIHTFSGATSFNQPLDNWTFSVSTNFQSMFAGATAFNQNIGNWNIANVSNCSYMFDGATNFNQDLGSWAPNLTTWFGAVAMFTGNAALSTANVDSIYNNWTTRRLPTSKTISMGTRKRTAASTAARALLTGGSATRTVSSTANNGSGLVRIVTSTAHGRTTGDAVFIHSIVGTTEANGKFIITVINTTTFDITATYVNPRVSGGTVITGYGWTVTDGGI